MAIKDTPPGRIRCARGHLTLQSLCTAVAIFDSVWAMRRQLRAFNYLLHRKFRRISQVYSSAEAATGMIHGWMVLPTLGP